MNMRKSACFLKNQTGFSLFEDYRAEERENMSNLCIQGFNKAGLKGLVMEGGAMRGMFTCGVIDVLMEHRIEFDGAIGVSAGAAFGCNYKSRQIGRAIRYNKRFCSDRRYASIGSLIKTGDLFNADFCYERVPFELDLWDEKAFCENPMEFYVTCTDVETGKPVYHKLKDGSANDIKWIRASASMPLVSKVVEIDGYKLLDGGMTDSVPIRYFERLGYRKNVVILTQPAGFVKKKNEMMPLLRIVLRRYPKVVDAMEERHNLYNKTMQYIHQLEEDGEVFVIRPPEALKIGRLERNPDELERVYQIGRETASGLMGRLKEYLAEC